LRRGACVAAGASAAWTGATGGVQGALGSSMILTDIGARASFASVQSAFRAAAQVLVTLIDGAATATAGAGAKARPCMRSSIEERRQFRLTTFLLLEGRGW